MTPDERRRRMRVILNRHNDIARELRESTEAFHSSATHVDEVNAALVAASTAMSGLTAQIRDMAAAGNKALTAMIAANEAAMALWNDEDQRP